MEKYQDKRPCVARIKSIEAIGVCIHQEGDLVRTMHDDYHIEFSAYDATTRDEADVWISWKCKQNGLLESCNEYHLTTEEKYNVDLVVKELLTKELGYEGFYIKQYNFKSYI